MTLKHILEEGVKELDILVSGPEVVPFAEIMAHKESSGYDIAINIEVSNEDPAVRQARTGVATMWYTHSQTWKSRRRRAPRRSRIALPTVPAKALLPEVASGEPETEVPSGHPRTTRLDPKRASQSGIRISRVSSGGRRTIRG